MLSQDKLLNSAALATFGNIVGRSANLIIPYSLLLVYGATRQTDVFFLVFSIAYLFFGTIANSLCDATVTMTVRHQLRLRPVRIISAGFSVGLLVFAVSLYWIETKGSQNPVYALALSLMALAGICNGIASGFLHASERYAITGLTWGLRIVPLAAFLLLFSNPNGLAWLAVGIGIADFIRFQVLIKSAKSTPPTKTNHDSKRPIRKFARTYITFMIAMLIFGLNPVADRLIAGLSGPGSISLLEAGNRFYDMLASVATMGIMTALLTHASKTAQGNLLSAKWRSVVAKVMLWCGLWLLFGVAGGIWGLNWWIGTVKNIAEKNVQTVMQLYWFYLPGMPGLILFSAYIRKVQALGRLGTLVSFSILFVVLNIILSLFLRIKMGIPGIALATTLTNYLAAVTIIITTRFHYKAEKYKDASHSRGSK